MIYRLILAIFFAYLVTGSQAHALGRVLSDRDWFVSQGVLCGNIRGAWIPGFFNRQGLFVSHLEQRKAVLNRAKRARGKTKKALQKSAKLWAIRNAKEASFCATGGAVSATPTAISTPGFARTKTWTVMVYMAADNNLAIAGLQDIDEMEAGGGSSDEVSVVVQAEFNADYLAQANIKTPQDFNRPDYDTFRYEAVNGSSRVGPDGNTLGIGNRVMTSPEDLTDFITWTKQNYPAEHYLLILWNHGGGFLGLLQDETSTGGKLMSLQELRQSLQAAGKVDIINFDMCLMAQYETLNAIQGYTDYIVASEEVTPGEGNPYDTIVQALRQNPSMSPAQVATMVADRFHESFQGHPASTTISAISMARFGEFDQAINQISTLLSNKLSSLKTAVKTAAANAQRYALAQFKDIKHAFDQLATLSSSAAPSAEAVTSILTAPNFMLANHARTGESGSADSVDNSNGLSVTLPSLQKGDVFSDDGRASFANYQAQVPGKNWTYFLADYISGSNSTGSVSLGDNRREWYLVWAEQAISQGAEVDVVILEPSGDIYIPRFGTVTPNGVMTTDSRDSGFPYEGYAFRETVEAGTYYLLALLMEDPKSYEPYINVVYRFSPKDDFSALYSASAEPSLSTRRSFKNDSDITISKIFAGAYTDFISVASWCVGDQCSSGKSVSDSGQPRLTKQQIDRLTSVIAERKVESNASLGSYIRSIQKPAMRSKSSLTRLGTEYFWERMSSGSGLR